MKAGLAAVPFVFCIVPPIPPIPPIPLILPLKVCF